jgi:hypothetical protein
MTQGVPPAPAVVAARRAPFADPVCLLALALRQRDRDVPAAELHVALVRAHSRPAQFRHRIHLSYVDRILKGANPGDLPIEQVTRVSLMVNRKTAQSLGVTVPQSILLRADRVIE